MMLLFTANISASSYNDQLKGLESDQKKNQSDIKDGKEEIKNLNKTIDSVVTRIRGLDVQINDFEANITQVEADTAKKEEEIKQTQQELEDARIKQKDYLGRTERRIQVMYEQGNSAYIEVLLACKDLTEFFNQVEYLNAVMKYDNNMLQELEDIKKDIHTKEVKLEDDKAGLVALKEEYDSKKTKLLELQSNKQAEMDKLEEERETVEARLKALEEEDKKIAAAIKDVKSKLKYDGGKIKWPFTNNKRVTSPFGMRLHPVLKQRRLHTGIDIAASTGTSVKAVYKGTVIFAQYMSAWGNYILVDHGSGYISAYAHNSKLLVKKGDKVKTGQVIAKAGSTGWSTGPHLHFGIKKNGKWIDPIPEFKKK